MRPRLLPGRTEDSTSRRIGYDGQIAEVMVYNRSLLVGRTPRNWSPISAASTNSTCWMRFSRRHVSAAGRGFRRRLAGQLATGTRFAQIAWATGTSRPRSQQNDDGNQANGPHSAARKLLGLGAGLRHRNGRAACGQAWAASRSAVTQRQGTLGLRAGSLPARSTCSRAKRKSPSAAKGPATRSATRCSSAPRSRRWPG